MITSELARKYHCPRWNELPAVPLYMDQVVMVVRDALYIFGEEDEPIVTPAMINNYVKQKLIEPAEKKKYGRHQVSRLVVVNLFKRVFSMQEILGVISALTGAYGTEEAYNLFCEELESFLATMFDFGNGEIVINRNFGPERQLLRAALAALLSKLLVQNQLDMNAK